MRRLVLLLAALPLAAAENWTLEKLFTRPYVWGTSPESVAWSKTGATLGFLWNESGDRFLDLYAYNAESKKLTRLTDLRAVDDEAFARAVERDPKSRLYRMPPAGLTSFDLSADGSRAAFALSGDLFVVNTDGSAKPLRLTRTSDIEASPHLSPDAKRLAFTRGGQVYVQDLSTGALTQATRVEGGELGAYSWSPAGDRISYRVNQRARRIPVPNYSGAIVRSPELLRTLAGDEPAGAKHFIVELRDDAKPIEIDAGEFGDKALGGAPLWSDDSRWLLRDVTHPKFKKRQILLVDARTGKSRKLWEEEDAAWVASGLAAFSPDSTTVYFTSEKSGYGHLYTRAVEGDAAARQVTSGPWELRGERFGNEPEWAGGRLYFSSTEVAPSERQFYSVKPDGSDKRRLSTTPGLHAGFVSDGGKHTAMLSADLDRPFDLWVDGRRITTSPRPNFTEYPWARTRFVEFKSRADGKTVQAKLLLPPGWDPANRSQKPRAAVFFIHGAGYATSVLKQWGAYQENRFVFNCWLANEGYVVLDMDYRGSSGYGRDWRTDVYLHLGGPDLGDVLGGVDYLKSLGNIDTKRLGIWGISYGGFMTDMALFQAPGVFKAGSGWASVNDWENYNAGYTGQRLNSPKENPEAYRRSSPIHYSQNLRDKLQIVHGIVDSNVLFQDAVQLTEKLIHEGKDFEEIFYPQENHGFVRDETWIDAFRRTGAWMKRWLGEP